VKFVWQISWHPTNGANLERFLNGPFVKQMGFCQTNQNGPIPKKVGQN
jgi:hypothetical protein